MYLPAVLASAEIPLVACARGLGPLSPLRGPSLIYYQSSSHEGTPITGLHCLIGKRVITYFYKPEPSGLAAETIAQDINRVDMHARFLEESLNIRFGSFVGQIPYEQLRHLDHLLTLARLFN